MNMLVSVKDDGVRASSRDVATSFGKEHRDVLRAIDNLIAQEPQLSLRNFAQASHSVPGPNGGTAIYRAFEMDRDGFALLAMGFTGPKALKWKLAYIAAFNAMETALKAVAANDPSPIDVPSLGTRDDRDALRVATLLVRECKDLYGQQAGREMWQKMGFPVPGVDLSPAPAGPGEVAVQLEGGLHGWTAAAGVKPSRRDATSVTDLYASYSAWCDGAGLRIMSAARFRQAVTMLFGTEEHPEMVRVVLTRRTR